MLGFSFTAQTNMQMEDFKRNHVIYDEFKYEFYGMKNHNFEADILCFAVEELDILISDYENIFSLCLKKSN